MLVELPAKTKVVPRLLKVLIDKGVDLLFELRGKEEASVTLPPVLAEHAAEAEELLRGADELLSEHIVEAEREIRAHEWTPLEGEPKLLERGLTRGKRKLLDAMRELSAAEDHLVSRFPELATEVRKHRKKIEGAVL